MSSLERVKGVTRCNECNKKKRTKEEACSIARESTTRCERRERTEREGEKEGVSRVQAKREQCVCVQRVEFEGEGVNY